MAASPLAPSLPPPDRGWRSPGLIRLAGLVVTAIYAAFIVWIYAVQPRTLREVRGGVAASMGVYRIDAAAFDEGLRFFRTERFPEARRAFERADPAQRDPKTQYYIAYAFLRQGWGRVYADDALYREAQVALQRALAASGEGVVRVDDPDLALKTSDEMAEALARGLRRDASDLNPLSMLEKRP
jgi:tetratricopeptide (TPR) repeat protein